MLTVLDRSPFTIAGDTGAALEHGPDPLLERPQFELPRAPARLRPRFTFSQRFGKTLKPF